MKYGIIQLTADEIDVLRSSLSTYISEMQGVVDDSVIISAEQLWRRLLVVRSTSL